MIARLQWSSQSSGLLTAALLFSQNQQMIAKLLSSVNLLCSEGSCR